MALLGLSLGNFPFWWQYGMVQLISLYFRQIRCLCLASCLGFALFQSLTGTQAIAQHDLRLPVVGYITSMPSPGTFYVNDLRVTANPKTPLRVVIGDKITDGFPQWDDLQVGAYVEVKGKFDSRTKSTGAKAIYLRNDRDRKLFGIGVIDKVISTGSEPVFRADGYIIRITAKTATNFPTDPKNLAAVEANDWLRFEGKRDRDGVVIATHATFLSPKPVEFRKTLGAHEDLAHGLLPGSARHKKDPTENPDGSSFRPAINPNTGNRVDFEKTLDQEGNLTEDAGIRWGALGGWHTIPADRALQERVRRVGMSVVPAYQKDLPDDDPSKIHFRFYAIDENDFRGEYCPLTGLILIPRKSVERMANDAQLATVLADGVAYNLQRQAARVASANRLIVGVDVVASTALLLIPAPGAWVFVGGPTSAADRPYVEERARISLGLIADAGYDPYQAPEAWRRLAPKHMPQNPDSLPYGDLSGYQLSILNLQYPKSGNPLQSGSASLAAGQPTSGR